MNVRKSDDFISDVEQQFEWYAVNANWEIAGRYLAGVEATCRLLAQYPLLGPPARFSNPRLRDWRFIVVIRPFQNMFFFTKWMATESCSAAPCTVIATYRRELNESATRNRIDAAPIHRQNPG